jgi:hypothetical protein
MLAACAGLAPPASRRGPAPPCAAQRSRRRSRLALPRSGAPELPGTQPGRRRSAKRCASPPKNRPHSPWRWRRLLPSWAAGGAGPDPLEPAPVRHRTGFPGLAGSRRPRRLLPAARCRLRALAPGAERGADGLLHAHPVNRPASRRPGRWSIRSGPGAADACPPRPPAAHDALWSNDPVARGIARLLQIEGADAAGRLRECRHPRAGRWRSSRRWNNRPAAAMRIAWRDALENFEAEWLAPALGALRNGRLDRPAPAGSRRTRQRGASGKPQRPVEVLAQAARHSANWPPP